jgi:hypothetical protein
MAFIRRRELALSQFYERGPENGAMNISSLHTALTDHPIRSLGYVAIGLLFLISVVQLHDLPSCASGIKLTCSQGAVSNDAIDLWRGLALGSLYLLFCLPAKRRPGPNP